MVDFAYDALRHDKPEVRLLEIAPRQPFGLLGKSVLRCRLLTCALSDAPPYEALSYTWGASQASQQIQVNGRRLCVTENLYGALCRFRRRDAPRLLWADAICINQSDKSELGRQVQIMPDIYRRASGVLVWLGPGDRQSAKAMKYLAALGVPPGNGDEDEPLDRKTRRRIDPFKHLDAVAEVPRLLSCPWFSRVWIIQEVAMAKEVAVHCGDRSISWSALARAVQVFSCWDQFGRPLMKNQSQKFTRGMHIIRAATEDFLEVRRNVDELDAFRQLQRQKRKSVTGSHRPQLEDVFDQMRGRGTSDPRDRIYAASSLLPHDPSWTLAVDYTLADRALYEQVALSLFHRGTLHFLQYCQIHMAMEGLPTWVPNWSEVRLTAPLQGGIFTPYYKPYKASAESAPKYHCQLDEDGSPVVLTATGRVVGTIETLTTDYDLEHAASSHWEAAALTCAVGSIDSQEDIRDTPVPDVDSEFGVLPPVNEPSNHSVVHETEMRRAKYRSGCTMWEAYVRTLIADRSCSDASSEKILVALDVVRAAKRYEHSHFSWSPHLMTRLPHSVTGKALLVTGDKYMGLGPRFAEEGDVVVVLDGMEVPMVLRRAGDVEVYIIIGEAYIHGIMDGQLYRNDVEVPAKLPSPEACRTFAIS